MSKTVLITGASSGLGLAHAIYLASKGYHVIGTSRQAEQLENEQLKQTFLRDNSKYTYEDKAKTVVRAEKVVLPRDLMENLDEYIAGIAFVTTDLTDGVSVEKAAEKAESIAAIDILINNAGCAYWNDVVDTTVEFAEALFQVNYFGQLRMIKAILPYMLERQSGLIVNTSSLAAIVGIPFIAHYSAAKAGVERLTEALRLELAPFNIHVCSLLPGDMNTNVLANSINRVERGSSYVSTNTSALLNTVQTPTHSPRFHTAKRGWQAFVRSHIEAPGSLLAAKKMLGIIREKRPQAHYTVGTFMQTKLMVFLHKFLPEALFLQVLANVLDVQD